MMDINIAVVPVAGLGRGCCRDQVSTQRDAARWTQTGRAMRGRRADAHANKRLLFITGPGKTSIENHFDLNEELIKELRETGKEKLLEELEYERARR
jgi:UTP--glucose-1-phosphate uridylyltransferase